MTSATSHLIPTRSGSLGPREYSVRFLAASIALTFFPLGCDSAAQNEGTETENASPPAVAVRISPVVLENVVPEITLVGTVTAIRRSVVGSPVDGRVTQMHVEAGDLVSGNVASGNVASGNVSDNRVGAPGGDERASGEAIVQLSTETVEAEIAAAEAELRRLEQELQQLRSGNRPEEVARAKAYWEAAKATCELAEARLRRNAGLKLRNAVSSDELEAAESAAQTSRQNLIAAEADYNLMKAGPRTEQVAQSVAKVERQKQEIARLGILRSYHTVHAPFEGHVVQKHTEVGQWLNRGDPVAEIVSLDPIDVVVHVPESLINELRTGDDVPLHVAALPPGKKALEGKIHGIGPSADQRARTFPVRIRLRNPQQDNAYLLRDGMQARAVVAGAPRSTLLVSKDALILGGGTPVVMVARTGDDGQTVAVQVDVETGVARGSRVEVRGDLQAGQNVIVDGNERIRAGQTVRVVNEISG